VKTEIGKSMELLLEKHPVGIVGSKHRKVADGGVFGANTANLLVTNTDISTLVLIKTATNTLTQTVTNTSKAPAKKKVLLMRNRSVTSTRSNGAVGLGSDVRHRIVQ
jgi:hypothetical protein